MEWIPDSVLVRIFSHLDARQLVRASAVCARWVRVARDEQLWKARFAKDFGNGAIITTNNNSDQQANNNLWLSEYRRLHDHTPRIRARTVQAHTAALLHVAYNRDGTLITTCSADGTVKIWKTRRRADNDNDDSGGAAEEWPVLVAEKDLAKLLYWSHPLRACFNSTDTLLLVSGETGDRQTGQLAVFRVVKKQQADDDSAWDLVFVCRALNDPIEAHGCWFDDQSVLHCQSGRFGRAAALCDMYFVHAAGEQTTSTRLFQFYNSSGGLVRHLTVVAPAPDPYPDPQGHNHCLLLFTTGQGPGGIAHQLGAKMVRKERVEGPIRAAAATANRPSAQAPSAIAAAAKKQALLEARKKLSAEAEEKPPPVEAINDLTTTNGQQGKETGVVPNISAHGVISENGPCCSATLLAEPLDQLVETGEKEPEPAHAVSVDGAEEASSSSDDEEEQHPQIRVHTFDRVDRVIEAGGRIVGLALSPDHDQLFVYVRPLTGDRRRDPPPDTVAAADPSSQRRPAEVRIVDLRALALLDDNHCSFPPPPAEGQTPQPDHAWLGLDANQAYVLGGGGHDGRAHLWDRRHRCLVRSLVHPEGRVVHSVALNPARTDECATATQDGTLTLWRSASSVRKIPKDVRSYS